MWPPKIIIYYQNHSDAHRFHGSFPRTKRNGNHTHTILFYTTNRRDPSTESSWSFWKIKNRLFNVLFIERKLIIFSFIVSNKSFFLPQNALHTPHMNTWNWIECSISTRNYVSLKWMNLYISRELTTNVVWFVSTTKTEEKKSKWSLWINVTTQLYDKLSTELNCGNDVRHYPMRVSPAAVVAVPAATEWQLMKHTCMNSFQWKRMKWRAYAIIFQARTCLCACAIVVSFSPRTLHRIVLYTSFAVSDDVLVCVVCGDVLETVFSMDVNRLECECE